MIKLLSLCLFCFMFLMGKVPAPEMLYAGPIIDMHAHLGLSEAESGSLSAERRSDLAGILAHLRSNGLVKTAIITMAQKGEVEATRRKNDSIIQLAARNDSLIPVCSVHPLDGSAALAEMERVHKKGVQVIKLHPNYQHFDVGTEPVSQLAEKAGELNMILLFDSYNPMDVSETGKLLFLGVTHPKARLILAHMGLVSFPHLLTIEAFKRYPWFQNNIWFDLSAIAPLLANSPFRDQLVWTIRKIGVDQFLFGSDFPVFSGAEAVAAIHALGLSRVEEEKIYYRNACRLLGNRL